MTTTRAVLATSVALATLAIASCGKDMCVMGMGGCKDMFKDNPSTTPSTGTLKLTAPSGDLPAGQKMTFTATGGTKPYVFEVIRGGGTIDKDTGIFTAPSYTDTVMVQVTDAAKAQQTRTVFITL